jgi:hypothetical protein
MNRHPYDFINSNVDPFESDKRDKNPFNLFEEFEYVRKPIPYTRFSYKPTFYNTSSYITKCDDKQYFHTHHKDNTLKHIRKLCNNECLFNVGDDFDYTNITDAIHNNLHKCQVCYSIYTSESKPNPIVNMWHNTQNKPNNNYHKIKDTWDNKYGLSTVGHCQKCNKKITFDPLMYPNYDNVYKGDSQNINDISVSNDQILCVSCNSSSNTPFSFKYPSFRK